ncbi:MAG TPA: GAF domain-containing SpoIIE family protein phosphatase [Phycisphaerae bacterium]|nr:GAF domain-containing SpoIIE family protein phosphatase [Phycisphaerae bacterium]
MTDQDPTGDKVADLEAVLEVTRQLAVTPELPALLRSVERAARKVLRCERASVFLYDRDRQELYSKIATGLDELRIPANRGISGEVVQTRQVINVPEAYADSRFNPDVDKQTGFRTRNMLTFPLIDFDGNLVGVLQLLNKIGGTFDEYDERLGASLCAQVAVAVKRQQLIEQYAEKQRMEHDLSIACSIQQECLPSSDPQISGYDIAGWNRPADETGGDYYDFLPLSDGGLEFAVADATGHGIGPALVIAECRAILRAIVSVTSDLARAVSQANDLLCADLPAERFVTAFVGILRPERQVVRYLSAGHGPMLLYRAADDRVEQLGATGLPLGILPKTEFGPVQEVRLESGDILLVLTDGLLEWARADGTQFGVERTAELVRRHGGESGHRLIQLLYEAVQEFGSSTKQADDLTAVVVKRL